MNGSAEKHETMPNCVCKWNDTITFKENNARQEEQAANS